MKSTPLDAWTFARVVADLPVNGEMSDVSRPFKPLAEYLTGLTPNDRPRAFQAGCAALGGEGAELNQAVLAAEPEGPPPEVAAAASFATLADYARIASDQHWLWKGWIAQGVFNAVAAEPGTGKTRFSLDLARRLWLGLPWPDGQPNELPEGTRTLWVQGDRAFPEMLQAARAFGLPDEAVALGSSPDDPTGSLDLDDPETLVALADRIRAAAPGLVFIDTVGMTTSRNLCRPEDAREFFGPLMDLAASSGVAVVGLTHLSKDKEALGRRIVEKARVLVMMTKPDPEGQPNRRKLWVDKSADVLPPALGITMGDAGNDYDFTPPTEAEPNRGGRPASVRAKVANFIREALTRQNDLIGNELAREWVAAGGTNKTFWRTVDDMVDAGVLVTDGGPGTQKQKVLHLISAHSGPEEVAESGTEPDLPKDSGVLSCPGIEGQNRQFSVLGVLSTVGGPDHEHPHVAWPSV